MTSIQHPHPPRAAEFFTRGVETIPNWYHRLLEVTRTHVDVGALPLLEEAPRPFVTLRRELMEAICQQYGIDEIPSGFIVEER
jgi:hypothetical protein